MDQASFVGLYPAAIGAEPALVLVGAISALVVVLYLAARENVKDRAKRACDRPETHYRQASAPPPLPARQEKKGFSDPGKRH